MISSDLYKRISDLISSIQNRGEDILENLNFMETHLSNNEVPSNDSTKQWLENTINENYSVFSSKHYSKNRQILIFVRKLQEYTTEDYGPVNDFLSDNNIKVLPMFAEISEEVGYPIDPGNIEIVTVS